MGIKSITMVKNENNRVVDQIEKLEYQCIQLARKSGDNPPKVAESKVHRSLDYPMSGAVSPSAVMGERERKYLEAINQIKRSLEQERKGLKQARTQHMQLLAERTELEIFLRQCIDDVRKEITRNSKILRARPASANKREMDSALDHYTASDRKRILEILMSKDRVLSLLYEKAFPYKHDPLARDREAEELDELVLQNAQGVDTQQLDMNHLWAKWKNWTDFNLAT
eukprot:NODE_803_length_784_cov_1202.927891_g541_i0.p1 GENE.NODE_803_length_784_cov_1202.927891_g541_i0~~NODE_803_length_784_cov_1202.927891_g541_i0.p1  ORF type:complete len:234 (+),score=54.51 NODE_803_length_784_cov_1202.927891_g541_i0:26-703(+)